MVGFAPVSPDVGEYAVKSGLQFSNGNFAYGSYQKTDPSCKNIVAASASVTQSGLVKLTAVQAATNGGMLGTFDITFGDQKDKVTGGFSAAFCDWDPQKSPTSCE